MRTSSTILCLLLVLTTAAQAQERVRTEAATYAFDPDGKISITTYKGSITVTPWDRAEVHIEARIEAEDFDGLIMLPDVDIKIGGSEQQLNIETDYRRAIRRLQSLFDDASTLRLPLVHYTVMMPRTAHLKIEDYMSNTNVADFQANLEVYSYKGDIELTNFGGSLKLDTFSGSAQVSFRNLLWDSSIESHEGKIAVLLPLGTGFDLAVALGAPQAVFAPDSSFAELRQHEKTRLARTPSSRDNGYSGSINGGGPRLNLSTHSGSFRLSTQ